MSRAAAFAAAALRGGFGAVERLTPAALAPRLDPEALIRAAGAAPSAESREGLARLMAALAAESELNLLGRLMIRWDMIRLLRNAEMVEAAHLADPGLSKALVPTPIFILGLPRSGTTFLHALLAEDASNLAPRNWQTIYPQPRPRDFNPARDHSARRVNRQLRFFAALAPGFDDAHPIDADSPQECSEITAHVFQSLRFDTTFRVPSYLAWMERHGDLAAFRFHKRFLQFLQRGLAGSWVLKCPDHTFSLDAILAVYPDARFVIVHRDPIDVFASVAHLTEVLRQPFLKRINAAEIGAQVSERWVEGAARLVAFDRRDDIDASRKFHLQHEDLVAAPLVAVARLYRQFGLELTEPAALAITRRLHAVPRGGYVSHAPYAPQRFKINTDALRGRFAPYVDQYCREAR